MTRDGLRTGFATRACGGPDRDSVPLALPAKGHRLHRDPADIDSAGDAGDRGRLPETYRRALTCRVAMSAASVVHDHIVEGTLALTGCFAFDVFDEPLPLATSAARGA